MVATQEALGRLRQSIPMAMAAGGGVVFLAGAAMQNPGLIGGGAVALCATWRDWQHYVPGRNSLPQVANAEPACQVIPRNCVVDETAATPVAETPRQATPSSITSLVDNFIATGRYALLLNPDTVSHLTDDERSLFDDNSPAGRRPAGLCLLLADIGRPCQSSVATSSPFIVERAW